MATAAIDPKVIKKTQETLGKVIKKPPLTEKHLSKPPFRYLHDMIMEISRVSNFFNGLYSGKELDPKGEWTRDDKINFFQKAIDVVGFTTGKTPRARPSKIIAGLEAEKTNELLQMIAVAILKKLDPTNAIEEVLKGEKPSSDKRGTKENEKKVERKKTDEVQQEDTKPTEDKENENETNKLEAQPEPVQPSLPPQERPQHRPGTRRKTRETHGSKGDTDHLSSEGSGSQVQLTERPSTAKGQRKSIEKDSTQSGISDETSNKEPEVDRPSPPAIVQNGLVPMPTRPSSSRPPAPRVIKKLVDSDEAGSRVNSGQEKKLPTVILDQEVKHEDDEDDDDDEFLVQDPVPLPLTSETPSDSQSKPEGALTKTLIEAKERLGGDEGKPTPRSVTISEAQKKREREIVQKEVSKLQGSIQSLSQTANPLGKIMDYVQEDIDSMEQELEMWKRENSQHADALRREEKITEDELAPLKAQLVELSARIDEQYDLISASKANILSNDQRIQQMLSSLNSR